MVPYVFAPYAIAPHAIAPYAIAPYAIVEEDVDQRRTGEICWFVGLFLTTILFLANYIQLALRTVNKGRYVLYMLTNKTSRTYRFQTPYTIVFFVTTSYFVAGYSRSLGILFFCVGLSKLVPAHRGVLERLNEDGILVP